MITLYSLPRHGIFYRLAVMRDGRIVSIAAAPTFRRAYQAALLRLDLLTLADLRPLKTTGAAL